MPNLPVKAEAAQEKALRQWRGMTVRDMPEAEQESFLRQASYDLAHSRLTAAHRYGKVTGHCLDAALKALKEGRSTVEACFDRTIESLNRRYSTMQIVGDYLADIIPEGGAILTQCFGETIIATVMSSALDTQRCFIRRYRARYKSG